MINSIATDLSQRVSALSPRDWVVAAGVMSLALAIAWIGRNVSRLIEALEVLRERVGEIDDDMSEKARKLWSRQDRLQKLVENQGKPKSQAKSMNWRDSALLTDERPSGELDLTKFDFRKP